MLSDLPAAERAEARARARPSASFSVAGASVSARWGQAHEAPSCPGSSVSRRNHTNDPALGRPAGLSLFYPRRNGPGFLQTVVCVCVCVCVCERPRATAWRGACLEYIQAVCGWNGALIWVVNPRSVIPGSEIREAHLKSRENWSLR